MRIPSESMSGISPDRERWIFKYIRLHVMQIVSAGVDSPPTPVCLLPCPAHVLQLTVETGWAVITPTAFVAFSRGSSAALLALQQKVFLGFSSSHRAICCFILCLTVFGCHHFYVKTTSLCSGSILEVCCLWSDKHHWPPKGLPENNQNETKSWGLTCVIPQGTFELGSGPISDLQPRVPSQASHKLSSTELKSVGPNVFVICLVCPSSYYLFTKNQIQFPCQQFVISSCDQEMKQWLQCNLQSPLQF